MATQNTLRDFGRYLQTHRHARGLSLSDVAKMTRVTPTNLLHIENEALGKLPADIFVKGFLRAYAEAVGADSGEAVRRYEAHCRRQLMLDQSQARHYGERFFYLRFLAALLLFALLIAATLYSFAYFRSMPAENEAAPADSASPATDENDHGTPLTEQQAEKQEDALSEQVAAPLSDIPGNTDKAGDEATQRQTGQLLELESTESTWLKIIVDGGAPKEFNLEPADTLTLKAREGFSLLIGNADGIRIRFNGKPVHIQEKSGQVVTLQLP